MNKYLKKSNGSALLIAVAVLIIFTVLGLSLLTLTVNGLQKNESRKDIIQATDLADKGIEFVVNDIQKQLKDEIKRNPMGKTDFGIFLENTLNKNSLQCPNNGQTFSDILGYKIPAENNNYSKVCIEKVEKILTNGVAEEKDLYKRLVTFKSIGNVKQKEKITLSQIIIGTDAIPDQLRYAISSNNGGNVYLHGAVEIQGDVKSDGNLIVANQATWHSTNNRGEETFYWEPSVTTRLIKNPDSVTPKIILNEDLNKNIYFMKYNAGYNSSTYNTHISITDSNLKNLNWYEVYNPNTPIAKDFKTYDRSHPKFFNTQNVTIHRKNLPEDRVDISTTISTQKNKSGVTSLTNNNSYNSLQNYNSSIIGKAKKESSFFYAGDKYCSSTNRWGYCTEYSIRYLDLNLNLNNTNSQAAKLVGTHYIQGDLKISNSNIQSDAILYVNGSVTIDNSILNSIDNKGTLIIFANGKISLGNISLYKSTPSKIKAFLYSKEELRLYGSGSNIELTGGLSGSKVILSAQRGNTVERNGSAAFETYNSQRNIINQSNNNYYPALNSRLKIIYDQELIESYTSFKRDEEEEFITEINPPEIVKR